MGGKAWGYFSATCWFFGRDLFDSLKYPIGKFAVDDSCHTRIYALLNIENNVCEISLKVWLILTGVEHLWRRGLLPTLLPNAKRTKRTLLRSGENKSTQSFLVPS